MVTKTCNDCKQTLLIASFHKDNSKKDKLCLYCKPCISKRNKAFQENDREYRHEYYLTNKMRIQEGIEVWQKAHRPQVKAYQKKYYAENRLEINRKRRELNALRKGRKANKLLVACQ